MNRTYDSMGFTVPTAVTIIITVFLGVVPYTIMHHIMTFHSTTDRIYDGGPIRL